MKPLPHVMRRTVAIGLLAAANVFVSFAFLWYVIGTLGAERTSDALFAAAVVPQLIMAILTASLGSVAVPLLANEDEATRRAWSWYLVVLATLVFLALATVLGVTAWFWVPPTVPGFERDVQELVVELARIQLLGVAPAVVVTLCVATENSRHRFLWAEASGVIAGLSSLTLVVFLLPPYGVHAAAWANVMKPVTQSLLLLPLLGFPRRVGMDSKSVKLMLARLAPLVRGAAYYKTDLLLDRVLASLAPSGGLTLLHVAQQLHSAASAIVSRAVASPALPILANYARQGRWATFLDDFTRRARALFLLSLITLGLFYIAGQPALSALTAPTSLPADQGAQLWLLLLALGGMWVGGNIGAISSVAYYAKGDTRTPTRLSVFTFSIYLPIKLTAFFLFGLLGLAISITLLYLVNAGLQVALLRASLTRGRI